MRVTRKKSRRGAFESDCRGQPYLHTHQYVDSLASPTLSTAYPQRPFPLPCLAAKEFRACRVRINVLIAEHLCLSRNSPSPIRTLRAIFLSPQALSQRSNDIHCQNKKAPHPGHLKLLKILSSTLPASPSPLGSNSSASCASSSVATSAGTLW